MAGVDKHCYYGCHSDHLESRNAFFYGLNVSCNTVGTGFCCITREVHHLSGAWVPYGPAVGRATGPVGRCASIASIGAGEQ